MMSPSPALEILAPLSGIMVPITSVPDPVFAGKMVGDGVSVDPTSDTMVAPVSGKVVQLHKAHHALTIRTAEGLDVLIHIGLDTVMLQGDGFSPMVKEGDTVTAGQPVIVFDLDYVGCKARSLLTQIVIANGELVKQMVPASGLVEAGKDVALRLFLNAASTGETHAGGDAVTLQSQEISLPNPAGLHARPAAVLAAEAKHFSSDIRILRGIDTANAKSIVSIMGLSTKQGDLVRVQATGPDAEAAVAALEKLITDGCGEAKGGAPAAAPAVTPAPAKVAADERELVGVSASPGFAIGRIFHFRHDAIVVAQKGGAVADERAKFNAALAEACTQIESLKGTMSADKAKILDAHKELLADPDLLDEAVSHVNTGNSAAYAWQQAFTGYAARLEKLDNALLRERANDIRDVGRRVLMILAGVQETKITIPEEAILVAEDLTPSDLAGFDRSRVRGFCTVGGGATSHVAIIARSFGLPAVCGIDEAVLKLADKMQVILDGTLGVLRRDPTEDELAKARERVVAQEARHKEEQALAHNIAKTKDGHHVEVAANIRNDADAREAVAGGADGVGLLRSEFLFDDREEAPSEQEQAEAYRAVAEVLGPNRNLVIRTLDVGGDKPLAYLPLPKEENPFLGLRGLRVGLDRPDLLRTQLRAILRAAEPAKLHIMFPMVASVDELRKARAILNEEAAVIGKTAKIGIMIEVPSAAVMAEVLAREVDFFSIGTNDLTQYVLAMDRGHSKLAKQADGLHPAVLRMIGMTVQGAHAHGKWVGVCGGLASEVMAVPVLVGLGVDELSVSVPAIASVKAAIGRVSLAECQALAGEILAMGTAAEVRARLASYAG